MAAFYEAPAPHERDLRSANHEWKRGKNSAEKWSRGAVITHGAFDSVTLQPIISTDCPPAKPRPRGKYCE